MRNEIRLFEIYMQIHLYWFVAEWSDIIRMIGKAYGTSINITTLVLPSKDFSFLHFSFDKKIL